MERQTVKKLNLHYYGSIATLAICLALTVSKAFGVRSTPQPVNLTVEMYAILATILIIPIALKTFADKLKKIRRGGLNPSPAIVQYKTAYLTRLYALAAVTAGNIMLYALSGNTNFFWLAIVLFVIFFFCKSSEGEVHSILGKGDAPEKTQE